METEAAITIPLFHCLFNADGSITHWSTSFDAQLYDELHHLYLVTLANDHAGRRAVPGAFMVKTSRHHDDPAFCDALLSVLPWAQALQPHWSAGTMLLPGKIQVLGPPPTEREFLQLAMQQFIKFGSAGAA